MPWDTSDRKRRLPRNWPTIRKAVIDRDPTCRCPGCPRCNNGCSRASTDADHVIPVDDHSMTNLRGLCQPCHALRSSGQGLQARGYGPLRNRPTERHPGMR